MVKEMKQMPRGFGPRPVRTEAQLLARSRLLTPGRRNYLELSRTVDPLIRRVQANEALKVGDLKDVITGTNSLSDYEVVMLGRALNPDQKYDTVEREGFRLGDRMHFAAEDGRHELTGILFATGSSEGSGVYAPKTPNTYSFLVHHKHGGGGDPFWLHLSGDPRTPAKDSKWGMLVGKLVASGVASDKTSRLLTAAPSET